MSVRTGLVSARGGVLLALAAALAAALLALSTVGIDPAEAKKKKASGGKIVFVSDRTTVDNPEGDREIFITNTDGKEPKQLTKNAASDFDPVLSPDGQKVAYTSIGVQTSNPEGDSEVYLINADGSNQKNLTDNTAADRSPNWGGKAP